MDLPTDGCRTNERPDQSVFEPSEYQACMSLV